MGLNRDESSGCIEYTIILANESAEFVMIRKRMLSAIQMTHVIDRVGRGAVQLQYSPDHQIWHQYETIQSLLA